MIPTNLNSSTSSHELEPYTGNPQASSSCLSSHAFNYTIQDQAGFYLQKELHHLEYQQEANNLATNEGSHDNSSETDSKNNRGLKFSLWKKEDGSENQLGSAKWTCSKMRAMGRTMMIVNSEPDHVISSEAQTNNALMKFEDQKQKSSDTMENDNGINSSSSNSNSPIRVCSDCNTTKTPLWRSGPRGPKSLCNACGIRQRKARKAVAVAAAVAATEKSNDEVLGAERSFSPLKIKLQHKGKRTNNGQVSQYKKRSKLATPKSRVRKKLCFEDFLISLSKDLAIQQVFPQDEKEAAILLMALSCGLVHG